MTLKIAIVIAVAIHIPFVNKTLSTSEPYDQSFTIPPETKEFDLPDAFSTKPGDMTIDEVNQAVVGNATSELYCHQDDAERLKELRWPSPNRPLLQMSGGLGADIVTDGVNSPPTRRNHRRYRR